MVHQELGPADVLFDPNRIRKQHLLQAAKELAFVKYNNNNHPTSRSSNNNIPTYQHTYIHTYLLTCLHTYIHTYIHIVWLAYASVHVYTHTYIHTYIHDIHTYMHTSMHACMQACIRICHREYCSQLQSCDLNISSPPRPRCLDMYRAVVRPSAGPPPGQCDATRSHGTGEGPSPNPESRALKLESFRALRSEVSWA